MADYKIAIADEHDMFLEGLKVLLEANEYPGYKVTAKANSGKDLISLIENEDFDALIFEIDFVDIEPEDLITEIKKKNKNIKLFVLSAYGDMKLVKTCFRLGVDGYLLKSSNSDALFSGLDTIFRNDIYIGENLKVSPGKNIESKNDIVNVEKKKCFTDRFLIRQKLTRREKEILELICAGMSNRMIAKELYISDHTVGVHRKHIMKKIGVTSTADLISFVSKFDILIKKREMVES